MSEARVNIEEVFDRIDDAFFALDEEWRFTLLNERAAELIDVDREGVVGADIWDEFEPAVGTTFQQKYEQAMETQEPVSFEEYYPPLERWFEVNAYPSETGLSVYFRDVTDRVERERELERYEAIVETTQDGIYVVSDEGTFTMVNDAYCELTGYDREELLGADVTTVVDEPTTETANSLERELAAGDRETAALQASLARKDGGTVEAEATFALLPDGDRVGVVRDITQRIERERELRRTRELLDQAQRVAEVGGWELDTEAREMFWTDHLFEILGIEGGEEPSVEEALGVYIERDRKRVEEAIETAIETGEPFDIEARFETPSEGIKWLHIQGVPTIEDGEVVALRGAAQDITERKGRERDLELYERVISDVTDGVYAVDEDNRFIMVNDAFCAMTGYDRADLLGEPVTTLKDPSISEEAERLAVELAEGERREATLELALRTKDGDRIPAEARLEPLLLGEEIGRCGIVRDITERKEHEAQLRDRLEQQEVVTNLGRRALENQDIDSLLSDAARLVAEALDVDYCTVLDLDDEKLRLRQGVGWPDGVVGSAAVSAIENDSQAAHTLSVSRPVVVENLATEERFSGPELLRSHGVTSGISTVIGPEDDPWGILGAHDTDERSFGEQEVNFVQSVANTLGAAINRHENERELRARHERLVALNEINSLVHSLSSALFSLTSKSDIEELVANRLATADSYEFAWVGVMDDSEVEVSAEAGVEDYLAGVELSLEDPVGRRGPTVQAHETGEMQVVQDVLADPRYEQWHEHAREHGYRASASVPIVDGGDQYGTLNVYSDRADAFGKEERIALRRLGSIVAYALLAVERDRELQRERDRLEFMNRLLRHNLLNSLNVIEARLDLLDGRVDYEVSDHLETAAGRTSEMIEFVETVREVTKVIGRGDEQELGPVDLGDALSTRVDRADRSHSEASFHLESQPSVDVMADDLLSEVLDNILVNAVQHNDTESPTVWVDTTVTDEKVVVAVADDGPGISDEEKPHVFDREAQNFENPDSGFGLYLVQEIIDSYDGDITVEDSTAGGARFELTFRRA
ncbi:MAG: PAS domain S-box-containing protein [Natronomonas sp.]|jgi:PAS domain S-box-containing protein